MELAESTAWYYHRQVMYPMVMDYRFQTCPYMHWIKWHGVNLRYESVARFFRFFSGLWTHFTCNSAMLCIFRAPYAEDTSLQGSWLQSVFTDETFWGFGVTLASGLVHVLYSCFSSLSEAYYVPSDSPELQKALLCQARILLILA